MLHQESIFLHSASVDGCNAWRVHAPVQKVLRNPSCRTGGLDTDKLREALLNLRTKTVLGDFAVDARGFQTAHKAITIQWQDGKQIVVWPDEVAAGTSSGHAPAAAPISVMNSRLLIRSPRRRR
jgi:hypothetical protein